VSGVLAPDELHAIERTAVELARLAGAEIVTSLGRTLSVRYKGAPDDTAFRDPVSEVDRHVETLIRARVAERFPGHDIIGEEQEERPGRGSEFIWAVDPVDGTANFVNGFPLFAASIGVLHEGRPVAGAIWCSATHALRAGVYHAQAGGPLRFDDEPLAPRPNPQVRRRLGGDPVGDSGLLPWETRKTGSSAIECAFVAAGLLQVAWFQRPNLWDVAGGAVLVRAAGGEVFSMQEGAWAPLDRFTAADLRHWNAPVTVGEPAAAAHLRGLQPPPAR
jgi:myo-inositol-1(or 4)-monophosphatase